MGVAALGDSAVDGATRHQHAEGLKEELADLSAMLRRGAYRAKPARRAHIPRRDGSQRPIGVITMEDKMVQPATVEVLNVVCETGFLGFSYGFHAGRSGHGALNALRISHEPAVGFRDPAPRATAP
jgi:RNA-directed DNA polymerase